MLNPRITVRCQTSKAFEHVTNTTPGNSDTANRLRSLIIAHRSELRRHVRCQSLSGEGNAWQKGHVR